MEGHGAYNPSMCIKSERLLASNHVPQLQCRQQTRWCSECKQQAHTDSACTHPKTTNTPPRHCLTFTRPSSAPHASHRPSGENWTEETALRCPPIFIISSLERTSHSCFRQQQGGALTSGHSTHADLVRHGGSHCMQHTVGRALTDVSVEPLQHILGLAGCHAKATTALRWAGILAAAPAK